MEKDKLLQLLKESKFNDRAEQQEYWGELWNQYVSEASGFYNVLSSKDAIVRFISESNYRERFQANGCEDLGVWVKVGDICYIDFGLSYLNEAGFQHFGIVLTIINNKAFVIPMTSNEKTYDEALKIKCKSHLMPIGKVKGMNKNSVLFLNDAKFINTARIIDVKAHIPVNSTLYKDIYERLLKTIS